MVLWSPTDRDLFTTLDLFSLDNIKHNRKEYSQEAGLTQLRITPDFP